MKLSGIRIEAYYVKEVSFSVRPDIESEVLFALTPGLHMQPTTRIETKDLTVNTTINYGRHNEDPSRYRVELIVDSANDPALKYPYTFHVVVVGFFNILPGVPEDQSVALIAVNAPGLLYSAAREFLLITTGRGPCPGVLLPSVSFADMAESGEPVGKALAESQSGPQPKPNKSRRSRKASSGKKRPKQDRG
jgi:preprotein translocase subunit SecB